MPTNTPLAPLETLLGNTRDLCIRHKKAFLTAAVAFGIVFAVMQLFFTWHMQGPLLDSVSDTMGIDPSVLERVMEENEQGIENGAGMEALMQEMENKMADLESMSEDEQRSYMESKQWQMYTGLLPAFSLSLILMVLLSVVSFIFFTLFALMETDDVALLSRVTVRNVLPMIGLWLWLFIRTFLWIPFLGIIIAFILGPRFVAAPVYLLRDNKGIMESARLSYGATRGYWGKIVGNLLVVAIAAMLVRWLVSLVVTILLGFSPYVSTFGITIIDQLIVGGTTVFGALLAMGLAKKVK